jgi:CRP-like cAMP-binding protein
MSSETFQELSFFQGLTPAQLDILLSLFVETNCHAGTVLFDQDEPAVFLYLVISGEVSIRYKPDDGEAITIARVRPGGIVGWSSAIGRRMPTLQRRSAHSTRSYCAPAERRSRRCASSSRKRV